MAVHGFFWHMPVIVAVVFAVLLLLKRDAHGVSAKVMGVVLLFWAWTLAGPRVIHESDNYPCLIWVDIADSLTMLSLMPTVVAYFCILTENRFSRRKLLQMFTLPVVLTLSIGLLYASLGPELSVVFLRNTYHDAGLPVPELWNYRLLEVLSYGAFPYILLIQFVWAVVYVGRLLRRYNIRIRGYYSYVDDKGGRTNIVVSVTFLGLIVVGLIHLSRVGALCSEYGLSWVNDAIYAAYAVCFFLVGRSVLVLSHTAADLEYRQAQLTEEAREDGLRPLVSLPLSQAELDRRLQQVLDSDRPYLQSDLTLDDLATKMGTDLESLARLFNEVYGISFVDYINILRIAVAEQLLALPEADYPLERVALESGFVSLVSFNRTFKKIKEASPVTWRKQFLN